MTFHTPAVYFCFYFLKKCLFRSFAILNQVIGFLPLRCVSFLCIGKCELGCASIYSSRSYLLNRPFFPCCIFLVTLSNIIDCVCLGLFLSLNSIHLVFIFVLILYRGAFFFISLWYYLKSGYVMSLALFYCFCCCLCFPPLRIVLALWGILWSHSNFFHIDDS